MVFASYFGVASCPLQSMPPPQCLTDFLTTDTLLIRRNLTTREDVHAKAKRTSTVALLIPRFRRSRLVDHYSDPSSSMSSKGIIRGKCAKHCFDIVPHGVSSWKDISETANEIEYTFQENHKADWQDELIEDFINY